MLTVKRAENVIVKNAFCHGNTTAGFASDMPNSVEVENAHEESVEQSV